MKPDPQDYLPPDLQHSWLVAPRESLRWIGIQAALLGAGVALTLGSLIPATGAGFVWALPVALGVMFLNSRVIRRREQAWQATLPELRCREPDRGVAV